ncbi:MAG: toll/interleukin-1 receptor domain-containing protein [Pseudomonadota bacterium]
MRTPTDETAGPDIFLSYKREERREASAMAQALEQVGWDVWWDPDLRGGEHFDDVIGDALTRSGCVVVLWSRAAVESRYIRDEASFGLKERKLVPVRLDDCPLPFRFEGLHTLDFSRWAGKVDTPEFALLQRDLQPHIGTPPNATGHTDPPLVIDPPRRNQSLTFVIASISTLALATALAWSWIDGGGESGECIIRFTVDSTGTRVTPRALELTDEADRSRALPLQRDPQTQARVTTTSLERQALSKWRVSVRWDDGTQSQFPVRNGCESGEEVSNDGLARLRITTL